MIRTIKIKAELIDENEDYTRCGVSIKFEADDDNATKIAKINEACHVMSKHLTYKVTGITLPAPLTVAKTWVVPRAKE
jgi:hypothetical protein